MDTVQRWDVCKAMSCWILIKTRSAAFGGSRVFAPDHFLGLSHVGHSGPTCCLAIHFAFLSGTGCGAVVKDTTMMEGLEETLEEGGSKTTSSESSEPSKQSTTTANPPTASFHLPLLTDVAILWTPGGAVSALESTDIVWALLGSSLSIFLSHLIPCSTCLVIAKD